MNTEQFFLTEWHWSPSLIAICAVALIGYLLLFGFRAKLVYLLSAIALTILTLASPIDTLADSYLFSAHMFQHMILLLAVPPLVLLSIPARFSHLESKSGNRFFQKLLHPAAGWIGGLSAMWIWHVPALCNAAAMNPSVKLVQTISLLAAGALFWRPLLNPTTSRRINPLVGVGYLFSACIGCSLLGIYISFSPVEICSAYLHPMDRLGIDSLIQTWGLTPPKDQELGGLMMWVPGCMLYAGGIMGQLARFYAKPTPSAPVPIGVR